MRIFKIIASVIVMIVVIILIAIVAVLINPKLAANAHSTFISPGGEYKLIVYTYAFPTFAMPGQGSDRDGFARVYNTTSGVMLCEMEIPLAGQVYENDVRWFPKAVALPGKDGFEDCPLS